MIEDVKPEWFEDVEEIVSDDLRFKKKLAIGEEAYKLLKTKNLVFGAWDTAGAAATGVAIAKSAVVANTFFASTSFWSFLGIGGAAVTPIGWVVAAGALSGSAWYMLSKKVSRSTQDRVTVIPEFINTPIDLLSLGIFNLICPLAIKVATVDGHFDEKEVSHIENYFIQEWGLNHIFVSKGVAHISDTIQSVSTKETANRLRKFVRNNPDCNQNEMCKDVIELLQDVMKVDGVIDEREEMIIDQIEQVLGKKQRFNFPFIRE